MSPFGKQQEILDSIRPAAKVSRVSLGTTTRDGTRCDSSEYKAYSNGHQPSTDCSQFAEDVAELCVYLPLLAGGVANPYFTDRLSTYRATHQRPNLFLTFSNHLRSGGECVD
jgi:hypothetical protein